MMLLCSLFAGLTAVCAWISIPLGGMVFTMQTFSLLLTLMILGGKWGSTGIGVYLLLGLAGVPVFAGFQGGPGVLLGPTGGYLLGFGLGGLVYWTLERFGKLPAAAAVLVCCYVCGSVWFVLISGNDAGFWAAVLNCVVPYLVPDFLKLALALEISRRVGKHWKK